MNWAWKLMEGVWGGGRPLLWTKYLKNIKICKLWPAYAQVYIPALQSMIFSKFRRIRINSKVYKKISLERSAKENIP